MRIRPLNDRIAVRRIEDRRGLIEIPGEPRGRRQRGEVVAVGPGRRRPDGTREPMDVQVGDVIRFVRYTENIFTLDGEELVCVDGPEVLAIEGR